MCWRPSVAGTGWGTLFTLAMTGVNCSLGRACEAAGRVISAIVASNAVTEAHVNPLTLFHGEMINQPNRDWLGLQLLPEWATR